jgi:hypothetical protein
MPPITTMAKIRPQQAISHQATTRLPACAGASARLENVRVIAKSPTPDAGTGRRAMIGAIGAAGQIGLAPRSCSRACSRRASEN